VLDAYADLQRRANNLHLAGCRAAVFGRELDPESADELPADSGGWQGSELPPQSVRRYAAQLATGELKPGATSLLPDPLLLFAGDTLGAHGADWDDPVAAAERQQPLLLSALCAALGGAGSRPMAALEEVPDGFLSAESIRSFRFEGRDQLCRPDGLCRAATWMMSCLGCGSDACIPSNATPRGGTELLFIGGSCIIHPPTAAPKTPKADAPCCSGP
jgi:hypothetical protein